MIGQSCYHQAKDQIHAPCSMFVAIQAVGRERNKVAVLAKYVLIKLTR